MAIVELITTFLKVFLELFKLWVSWSADERATKLNKIKKYTDSILDTMTSNSDFMDETAYYASISQEKRVRYEMYRAAITPVLLQGKGILELETLTTSGLNYRISLCRDKVINVLISGQSAINKAKLISKMLVELSSV